MAYTWHRSKKCESFSVGMEFIWLLCGWLKLIDFSVGIGIDLFFVWRSKLLLFIAWMEITSVFVSGHRNRRDIKVEIEIDLSSVMSSKLTKFLCARSKLTWF